MGGPIQKDKTFVFANYGEDCDSFCSQTSNTFVPALDSRAGTFVTFGSACPTAQKPACALVVQQLLNLWPAPNGPELTLPGGGLSGIAQFTDGAPQTIREDFGTLRLDHVFSPKDTLSAIYTVDDGAAVTATPLDPFSTDIANLREQVLSVEEKRKCFFSESREYGTNWLFSRRVLFPRQTDSGYAGGQACHKLRKQLPHGSGGCRRQHRFEPGNAIGIGRKQQRNKFGRFSEPVHLRGPADADACWKTSAQFWRMVSASFSRTKISRSASSDKRRSGVSMLC